MHPRLILPLGALVLAGCLGSVAPAVFSPQAAPAAAEPPTLAGSRPYEFTTAILDDAYQHPRLDAFVEATLRWWNVDNESHSVVSDDGQFPGSGPIPPHGEFAHTFLRAGDYPFHCRYHPDMRGIVVVR